MIRLPRRLGLLFAFAQLVAAHARAAEAEPFPELKWRSVGPIRAGRTKAGVGVPQRPGVFYIGAVNGGVWKTDDYGRTWVPIFDGQPTGSIGAIAIAPSNPDVMYVGSGEGLHRPDLSTGDGIYKSLDAGKTWRHLGLRDSQQIAQIIVDSRDPQRLFVAVLGHPYGPNEERGVFRSQDGGETFQKVLYKDADTGAVDLAFDPSDPRIVFAALWEAREGPWENGSFEGPGSGLYKSTDGGDTWRQLTKGLPPSGKDGMGRVGIAVAPSNPKRMYATVALGEKGVLFRSDDAGESWSRISEDKHVVERADDFAEVKVHPTNPDIVFTASVVVWKSTDGGKTFSALRGAPGGDDYHRLWIDPNRPQVMLIASDQGAIVTVNGGRTFSSWYNQSTAQMFHVTADNAFPYRLCGGQQDSGSACVSSRGDDGQLTFREWHPVGLEEYGYAAPDPLNPDIVYGGKLTRYDRRTGQTQNVAPVPLEETGSRAIRTQPVVFSPVDPHLLFFANNVLWKTTSGGKSWTRISPDLTRKTWEAPENVGKYRAEEGAASSQRGVIYAVAPSPVDIKTLWAGTDDGLIHVTHDGGKSWREVTPPELRPWAKVSMIDAGHSDSQTAYAAINGLRLDDPRPQVYRTHDGGQTWTMIASGLPEGAPVNAVREDPKRKGLLFVGTERGVQVSFDDGDHWHSLQLNLPATSVRDLVIKGDDLAIATHGRGFWILDDLQPLREIAANLSDDGEIAWPSANSQRVHLFEPAQAIRVRWNTNTDTPLPPDEPTSPNPPDGAVLDYWLQTAPGGEVRLEIVDRAGKTVRQFSSSDPAAPVRDDGNVPRYWIRPPTILSAQPGMHRFVWDLHCAGPQVPEPAYPISAVAGNTPIEPRGPWAPPGQYLVKLSAGRQTVTRALVLKMDPRVKTPPAALAQQFSLSVQLAQAMQKNFDALAAAKGLGEKLAKSSVATASELAQRLEDLRGRREPRRGRKPPKDQVTLMESNARLASVYGLLQDSDATPTTQARQAVDTVLKQAVQVLAQWQELAAEAAKQVN